MFRTLILFLCMALAFSCNNAESDTKEKSLLEKENELLRQENELIKREVATKKRADSLESTIITKEVDVKQPEKSTLEKPNNDAWTSPAEHGETDYLYVRKGKHNFTLQWLGWDKPGTVSIDYLGEGDYSIEGEQRSKDGYATIRGTFGTVSKKELSFTGEIITQVSYNNGGEPCIKDGTYKFLATGSRKYYRLQQMNNCEEGGVVDYVDIYF